MCMRKRGVPAMGGREGQHDKAQIHVFSAGLQGSHQRSMRSF